MPNVSRAGAVTQLANHKNEPLLLNQSSIKMNNSVNISKAFKYKLS
jgi:hypothetical protein